MRAWPLLLLLGAACHGRVDGDPGPAPRPSGMPSAAASARLPGAASTLAPLASGAQAQQADVETVSRTLLLARDRLRRCHTRSSHAIIAGNVELTLAVDPSGKVRSVATTTTFASPEVAECVERQVRALSFPPLEAPVTVVVPLEFAPARGPAGGPLHL